jgi:hypothetical protein
MTKSRGVTAWVVRGGHCSIATITTLAAGSLPTSCSSPGNVHVCLAAVCAGCAIEGGSAAAGDAGPADGAACTLPAAKMPVTCWTIW